MYVISCVASTSPLSKEGLWQNWMSTSGSAQLENESHIVNGSHHHHNGHHHCHHGENYGMECDRSKSCEYHDGHSSGFNNHSQSGSVMLHWLLLVYRILDMFLVFALLMYQSVDYVHYFAFNS